MIHVSGANNQRIFVQFINEHHKQKATTVGSAISIIQIFAFVFSFFAFSIFGLVVEYFFNFFFANMMFGLNFIDDFIKPNNVINIHGPNTLIDFEQFFN